MKERDRLKFILENKINIKPLLQKKVNESILNKTEQKLRHKIIKIAEIMISKTK